MGVSQVISCSKRKESVCQLLEGSGRESGWPSRLLSRHVRGACCPRREEPLGRRLSSSGAVPAAPGGTMPAWGGGEVPARSLRGSAPRHPWGGQQGPAVPLPCGTARRWGQRGSRPLLAHPACQRLVPCVPSRRRSSSSSTSPSSSSSSSSRSSSRSHRGGGYHRSSRYCRSHSRRYSRSRSRSRRYSGGGSRDSRRRSRSYSPDRGYRYSSRRRSR